MDNENKTNENEKTRVIRLIRVTIHKRLLILSFVTLVVTLERIAENEKVLSEMLKCEALAAI